MAAGAGLRALTEGGVRPGTDDQHGALVRRWSVVAAWASVIACLGTVLWQVGNAFDVTDEALYVLAADPPRRDAGFNGLSGTYLRPLWACVGWNVGLVRVVGLIGLAAGGAVLGYVTSRLLGSRPAVVVAVGVAASTGFYASGLRTPSYNWLAIVGAQLVCASILALLADMSPRWGLLAGAGLVVAAAGKVTTAVLLAVLLVVVALVFARLAILGWAAASLVLATVAHVMLILPVGETISLLRRSAAFLKVLDPLHYSIGGSIRTFATGILLLALSVPVGGGIIGLLPLVVIVRHGSRERRFVQLSVLAVGGAVLLALTTGAWSGIMDRPFAAGGDLLPVLAAIGLSSAIGGRLLLPRTPGFRAQLTGGVVLVAASLAYVFGSNVSAGLLLETATGLLAPACLLLAGQLPRPARDCLIICLLAGSLVVAVQAHFAPKRSASLAVSVVPVTLGPTTVRVDRVTAASLNHLIADAHAAGWRAGMPMIDASFTPAVPLALHATVPPVLVPTVPGWAPDSVCEAVRGMGAAWSNSWLLMTDDTPDNEADQIAAALGHQYPSDYTAVANLTRPGLLTSVTLLRPRPGTTTRGCNL